jgi:Legionella pneumophila major outer membrane protein precursor
MLNLKKTALAVIALGSTAAFAGTMGPVCSAVNVTVPCENTAWDIGGRALYLQPTTSAFSGNRTFTSAANSNTLSRDSQPSYGWGFQLEASYHYSTGNDFDLNWYHFRNGKTYQNANTVVLGQFIGNNFLDTPRYDLTDTYAYQSNSTAWDQVNMEFGQHVDFGENKFGRLHAGMNYSRVGNGVTSQVIGSYATTPGGTATNYNNYNARNGVYNGFGPRVGMDLGYDWGNGLSVYGNGALSVLAGTAKTSYNIITRNAAGEATGNVWYGLSNARVVPELDAKLGFMYTYAMAQGDLSFDIGWLWASYMGALSSDSTSSQSYSNNFGIQGLYFGLKWVGNVA